MTDATREQEVLEELVRATQGDYELADLLLRICRQVAEMFSFERTLVCGFLEERREIRLLAAHGFDGDALRALSTRLDDWPLLRRARSTQELVFVEDVRRERDIVPEEALEQFALTSALVVPLLSAGRCLGFLAADRAGEQFRLGGSTRRLLATVALVASTLLEKSLIADELRRLDRLKNQFVALASHELRTPAAVIYGAAATLRERRDALSEENRRALEDSLYSNSERLAALVDQLLDLSRLDSSAISIRPRVVHVRRRLEELLAMLRDERASDIALDVDPAFETVVDPAAFDRIASNLITNALRYGDVPIVVRAEQPDPHFILTVEDRGEGIAEDFLPRLFDRFSRSPSAQGSKGAGLGLAIARAYAHAHGGELLYEPVEPRGARFRLVVPAEGLPGAG